MSTQAVAQIPKNNEVEYIPFGADEKIKLSVEIIRKYVAAPSKSGKLPDDRECIQFMMLCRSRKLNPFEGDAFLIGYDGADGVTKWTLITAHVAFLKRAESHPEYNGMESGVMVKDEDGKIVDREGDFFFDDDKILGAWAVVHFKQRQHPMKKRVKISTFMKPFGVWKTDPAGMIVKCAEADALRSSFPSLLGGLYTREESPDLPVVVQVKTPGFGEQRQITSPGQAIQAPANVVQMPERAPEPPKQEKSATKQATKPEPVPEPAQTDPDGDLGPLTRPEAKTEAQAQSVIPPQSLVLAAEVVAFKRIEGETDEAVYERFDEVATRLLLESGVTEKQFMSFCRKNKIAKENQTKLKELTAKKVVDVAKAWSTILPEILKEPKE